MFYFSFYPFFSLSAIALVTLLTISPFSLAQSDGTTTSENLIFLQEDGRSYTQHRTLRSSSENYDFHVEKSFQAKDFLYIYPNKYTWDIQSSKISNILKFNQGSFVVMMPGRFDKEIIIDEQGIYTFSSWDGTVRDDKLFGFWNSPGNFTDFVYGWIIPDQVEVLSYQSNRKGDWVRRQDTLVFYSSDVNSLAFEIKYRHKDADHDGVGSATDKCPESSEGAIVDTLGCEFDSDNDGIVNRVDLCFDTRAHAIVDSMGCEILEKPKPIILTLDNVNFRTNSAELTRESHTILEKAAKTLEQYAHITLEIADHTYSMGNAEYNLQLSRMRAEAVRKYLIGQGIDPVKLLAAGYGESIPVADNNTKQGRATNRRVEILRAE